MQTPKTNLILSSRAYGFAKHLVQVVIPAFASLYFGLAAIWDLPASEEVVGTLAILATFLGLVLGISSNNYESSGAAYDGALVVTKHPDDSATFVLELNDDPTILDGKESIRFKVQNANEDEE